MRPPFEWVQGREGWQRWELQLVESNFLGGIDPNICTTGSQSHPPANQDHFVAPVSTISSVEGLSYISKYPIYAMWWWLGSSIDYVFFFVILTVASSPPPSPPNALCAFCKVRCHCIFWWRCIWYNKKKGWRQGHIYGRRGGYSGIFWGKSRI